MTWTQLSQETKPGCQGPEEENRPSSKRASQPWTKEMLTFLGCLEGDESRGTERQSEEMRHWALLSAPVVTRAEKTRWLGPRRTRPVPSPLRSSTDTLSSWWFVRKWHRVTAYLLRTSEKDKEDKEERLIVPRLGGNHCPSFHRLSRRPDHFYSMRIAERHVVTSFRHVTYRDDSCTRSVSEDSVMTP